MNVLVADDDRVNRILLEGLLARWGHAVTAVADGDEALRVMEGDGAPPLALLDWIMPGLSGPEICRRLRERPAPAPPYLILITSRDRQEDIVEGLEAGADDYVPKPFGADELRARVAVGERIVSLQEGLARRVQELETALADVRTLQGLLPMCAWCKKIRNEDNYWERVDTYISARSRAEFTHGICPECKAALLARGGARQV